MGTELLRPAWTSRGHLVPPRSSRATLSCAQHHVQAASEHPQGWRLHHLPPPPLPLGPKPISTTTSSKNKLPGGHRVLELGLVAPSCSSCPAQLGASSLRKRMPGDTRMPLLTQTSSE